MARINITAAIDLDNLAEEIADGMDHADVLAFIKYIDERIADLAFTRELSRHFSAEVARETDDTEHEPC